MGSKHKLSNRSRKARRCVRKKSLPKKFFQNDLRKRIPSCDELPWTQMEFVASVEEMNAMVASLEGTKQPYNVLTNHCQQLAEATYKCCTERGGGVARMEFEKSEACGVDYSYLI